MSSTSNKMNDMGVSRPTHPCSTPDRSVLNVPNQNNVRVYRRENVNLQDNGLSHDIIPNDENYHHFSADHSNYHYDPSNPNASPFDLYKLAESAYDVRVKNDTYEDIPMECKYGADLSVLEYYRCFRINKDRINNAVQWFEFFKSFGFENHQHDQLSQKQKCDKKFEEIRDQFIQYLIKAKEVTKHLERDYVNCEYHDQWKICCHRRDSLKIIECDPYDIMENIDRVLHQVITEKRRQFFKNPDNRIPSYTYVDESFFKSKVDSSKLAKYHRKHAGRASLLNKEKVEKDAASANTLFFADISDNGSVLTLKNDIDKGEKASDIIDNSSVLTLNNDIDKGGNASDIIDNSSVLTLNNDIDKGEDASDILNKISDYELIHEIDGPVLLCENCTSKSQGVNASNLDFDEPVGENALNCTSKSQGANASTLDLDEPLGENALHCTSYSEGANASDSNLSLMFSLKDSCKLPHVHSLDLCLNLSEFEGFVKEPPKPVRQLDLPEAVSSKTLHAKFPKLNLSLTPSFYRKSPQRCFRCQGSDHKVKECPFKKYFGKKNYQKYHRRPPDNF